MSQMIERLARAIRGAQVARYQGLPISPTDEPRVEDLEAARAALSVLLEPSKEMLAAGEKAVEDNIDETCDSYECYKIYDEMQLAHVAFTAMIQQALRVSDENPTGRDAQHLGGEALPARPA